MSAVILPHWSHQFTRVLSRETHSLDNDKGNGLPSRLYMFREHKIFEDLSPENDEQWHKVALARKGGFLWVKYNETANEAWGISMFHALHCLRMIRVAVQKSPYGPVTMDGDMETEHKNDGSLNHPDMDPTHLGHCIGYIAQVCWDIARSFLLLTHFFKHLLCAADSTLEPPWLTKNEAGDVDDAGVNGEGYQHQCRDPSWLWDVAVQSEQKQIEPWGWQLRDTVDSVF